MESRVNPEEAQAALAAVEQSRSDIAARLYTPWWYHPILGILVGGLLALAIGDVPFAVLLGALPVYGLGLAALVTVYRRRSGVWVNGTQAGPRSLRSLLRMGAYLIVTAIVGAAFSIGMEIRWTAWITGLVVALSLTVWGRHFDQLMRADLRESA
jgi:hypothetical protein